MKTKHTATETESTTVAVTSKPQTLKTYPVIALVASDSGGPPTVRGIKIQARCQKEAELLATALFVSLNSAQTQAITTEYTGHLIGSGLVLTVGPAERSKTAAAHVWTRHEIAETLSMRGSQELKPLTGGDNQLSLTEVGA